ncbi:Uu.00g060180.m01.CDS01 [Anthostomella pinea]|uniref:Uu.00g060180.m01.CDS01 n=1 Tax=Anthostomella pinea TaxID=933095 RepID=A0AAI8VS96_9PEZI|nr:Uu.00g060180.m01.CDS01 [Anthostomella pinea]
MGSDSRPRAEEEAVERMLNNEYSSSDDSGYRDEYWSSPFEKMPSTPISAFSRRLNRRHYTVILILIIMGTLLWVSPNYPMGRGYLNSQTTGSKQSVVLVSLPQATSAPFKQALPYPTTGPEDEAKKTSGDKIHVKPQDEKVHSSSKDNPGDQTDSKPKESPKEKPAEEKLAEEKPPKVKPVEEVPAKEEPVEEVPVKEKPVEEVPAKDKPVEKVPAKDEPANTPVKGSKGVPEEWCTTWPVDEKGNYDAKHKSTGSKKLQLDSYAPAGGWQKPAGVKIVAMVFYGRKRNVDILDCYLRQNLVSNGGYFDEVWFMVHTQIEDDVSWMRELVKQEDEYVFMDLGACTTKPYGCIWEYAVEDDTMYFKIDDDIMYIHHDTIPQMVHTRIAQPHPYAISAQLVNSPVTGLESYHYGAIHPFLPDPRPHNWRKAAESWRVSELPLYPRALNPIEGNPLELNAPYKGHPWLLLSDKPDATAGLVHTPMGEWYAHQGPEDIAWGPGWKSWGVAAQQLYSLLFNLEKNQLDRYHFGRAIDYRDRHEDESSREGEQPEAEEKYDGPGGEQLYDMQYQRYNLNFIAIWGRDVAAGLPIGDDELEVTQTIPARLGRPFVIDTRALVAHHSFFVQKEGVGATDLMDRWRAFANENVCAADNMKKPWDLRCPGF